MGGCYPPKWVGGEDNEIEHSVISIVVQIIHLGYFPVIANSHFLGRTKPVRIVQIRSLSDIFEHSLYGSIFVASHTNVMVL
jgi:hypothetical protein